MVAECSRSSFVCKGSINPIANARHANHIGYFMADEGLNSPYRRTISLTKLLNARLLYIGRVQLILHVIVDMSPVCLRGYVFKNGIVSSLKLPIALTFLDRLCFECFYFSFSSLVNYTCTVLVSV